jgi:uncharacterized RDD family membrane protein YckC
MKCPKCGYLGVEEIRRCRNCGYDFSLTPASSLPDLPIRRDDHNTPSPLDDLALIDSAAAPLPPRMTDVGADLDRLLGVPEPPPPASPRSAGAHAPATRASAARAELPLFGPPIPDDEPLITRPSPPRAPLAVRRSTPDVPRARADAPRAATLDLSLESEADGAVSPDPGSAAAGTATRSDEEDRSIDASVAARLIAVVIDLVILAAIDALVVYFTAQICGITLDDLSILPKGPLIAFLLVQNGGYLVAFTAGGQTLGKMAAGIRVVASEATAPLDLGRAFLRTVMWVILAVPAGLGFLSAIVNRNHRGLHDRFAGTRVVRA